MRIIYLSLLWIFVVGLPTSGLAQINNFQITIPIRVKTNLNNYLLCLKTKTFQNCAEEVDKIAGGGLLEPNSNKIRKEVINLSLKNDYNKVNNYFYPPQITNVTKRFTKGIGFGKNKLSGTVYKIWIKNKDKSSAPVSFILTDDKKIKLIGIGSL